MFLSAPVVGKLVTKIDPRLMMMAGFFISRPAPGR